MEPSSFISAAALASTGSTASVPAVKDAWSGVQEYFSYKSARLTQILADLESGALSEVRGLIICEELEKYRVFSDPAFVALVSKLEAALKTAPAPAATRAPNTAPTATPAASAPAPANTPQGEL